LLVYYYCKCETKVVYECNFDNSNKTTDCNDYTLTGLINENNSSNDSYIKLIESYDETFRITDFSSISKHLIYYFTRVIYLTWINYIAKPTSSNLTCNIPFDYNNQSCYHCCGENFSCDTDLGLQTCFKGIILIKRISL